ncbi:Hsp70 nucleotide exchange factor FES1 [Wickerhamomyces ciferrii]|uniref:Hsp70 nucleotide exchange factor FES1 n=1 Tax=Wickerhamomyces ciferrii (strain ATCC 14091 / BCRC 22168 / CBS 111 / JCM 3599 / NBRC 0793 / NRRL Y-1031 F-60-10) TaxID=1206466 RepID=K0KS39_WICCF|nr:Hsp70 nucleotide exchange factor FES1 [Wickerhamomyces ciferrii]CCH45981.1 Hsp70 nucleotide exchange factor FES1 [Wickerhamomyces ciferrii]
MDKLLNWSLAQQDPETASKVGAPDPKLLAELFGQNVDDPTLMKQNIELIESNEATDENKLISFDNFEMLIENLDNANNIENLKLWPKLIKFLDWENLEFVNLTLSIIGTSVQNNNKSQLDFLKYDTGLSKLIQLAQNTKEVRVKALYALSNLIRNNEKSYEKFNDLKGWELIGPIISNPEVNDKTILRSLSLFNSIQTIAPKQESFDHIHDYKIIKIFKNLIKSNDNINVIDKILNTIVGLINDGYKFDSEELGEIKNITEFIEKEFKDVINLDDLKVLKQVN